jgi:hypothetical protein
MGVVSWGRMTDWSGWEKPSRKPDTSEDNRPEGGGARPSGNKMATIRKRKASQDIPERPKTLVFIE